MKQPVSEQESKSFLNEEFEILKLHLKYDHFLKFLKV